MAAQDPQDSSAVERFAPSRAYRSLTHMSTTTLGVMSMTVKRPELSKRVTVGAGSAVAAFALLGSGLIAVSAAATSAVATPASYRAVTPTTQLAPEARRGFWAAIKLADDGTAGKATNRRTARRAERAAGRNCRRDTPLRCDKTSTTFSHTCGAIAVRMRNGRVASFSTQAGQATKRAARRAAVRSCESGGLQCRVAAAVCTRGR
jgi:Domain of unknown function (DUF4189)